jgi:hypothetical protein
MRDTNGTPTIIDALVGAISLTARRELDWLDAVCGEVQRGWESGMRPPRWDEAVEDAEL